MDYAVIDEEFGDIKPPTERHMASRCVQSS
jgi:hypothetical protein